MEMRDIEVLRADLFAAHQHLRTLRNVVRDTLAACGRLQDDLAGLADELGIQLEGTAEGGHSHEQDEDASTRQRRGIAHSLV